MRLRGLADHHVRGAGDERQLARLDHAEARAPRRRRRCRPRRPACRPSGRAPRRPPCAARRPTRPGRAPCSGNFSSTSSPSDGLVEPLGIAALVAVVVVLAAGHVDGGGPLARQPLDEPVAALADVGGVAVGLRLLLLEPERLRQPPLRRHRAEAVVLERRVAGLAAIASAWSDARTSIHMIAGRRWPVLGVHRETVDAVASTEMPAMSSGETPLSLERPRTASTSDDHHSSGSCSAQPGRGCEVSNSTARKPAGVPSRSNRPTRTPPVP